MDFDLNSLSHLTALINLWGAAFVAALWLALIYWTYRDAGSRTQSSILKVLAALLVVGLFIPGVLIYLIVRPRQTIEETYFRTLEEEALLRAIEDKALEQDGE